MTHRSEVDSHTFALIASRQRVIEPRVYDVAHRQIKIGDLVLLVNRDTKAELLTKVVGLLKYPSFKELFAANPLSRFGAANEAELHRAMRQFYPLDAELKNGVVGLKLHALRSSKQV